MNRRAARALICGTVFMLILGGCGSPKVVKPENKITSVTVAPASQDVKVRLSVGFAAVVSGTGAFSTGVIWSVNDVPGGNMTLGTVSSSGIYTAPALVPSPASVTVKATSVQDAGKSGTATLRVHPEISVSPDYFRTSWPIAVGGSYPFSAQVIGLEDKRVTWSVNGLAGGDATVGTVVPSAAEATAATYTAPAMKPVVPVLLRATSVALPDSYGEFAVEIHLKIAISPERPQITSGATQQFTVTVEGATDTTVIWSAVNGTITAGGLYTAPRDRLRDQVTAAATADPASVASLDFNLTPLRSVITGISPQPATSGQEITVTGENFYGQSDYSTLPHIVTFSAADGSPIMAQGRSTTATEMKVTVPPGAVSGPMTTRLFMQQCDGIYPDIRCTLLDTPVSDDYPFHRLPRLRLRAPRSELGSGESVPLQHSLLGGAASLEITYTADKGSVDASGAYTAPSVTGDETALVTGCFVGTEVCDSIRFAVRPFAIRPRSPAIKAGESVTMSTEPMVAASWQMLAGAGALLPNGFFTAGITPQDAGGIPVAATYSGHTEKTAIGVSGLFPGMVNRLADNGEPPHPEECVPTLRVPSVAVSGNRLYALGTRYACPAAHWWIDSYDISDPVQPIWLGAVEPVIGWYPEQNREGMVAAIYAYGNHLLVLDDRNSLWDYDVAANPSGPVAHITVPTVAITGRPIGMSDGVLYSVDCGGTCPTDKIPVVMVDVRNPDIRQYRVDLPVAQWYSVKRVIGGGNRIYVVYDVTFDGSPQLATYDIGANPPVLLAAQPMPMVPQDLSLSGNVLAAFGTQDGFSLGTNLFDVSTGVPRDLGYVARMGALMNAEGGRWLVSAVGNVQDFLANGTTPGLHLMDMTDVAHPQVQAVLIGGPAQLAGDYVYVADDSRGLTVWDVSAPGGGYTRSEWNGGWRAAWDLASSGNLLYVAGHGTYDVYDAGTTPPSLVGSWAANDGTEAVEVLGNYLFAGMDSSLTVLDISTPSAPRPVTSIPVNVRSEALKGTTLYAATWSVDSAPAQLKVFDVSAPATPQLMQTLTPLTTPENIIDMQVHGNLLLLAAERRDDGGWEHGILIIYDVSQPNAPVLLSRYPLFSWEDRNYLGAEDVAADGNLAFVAGYLGGLAIIDISNPAAPVLVSRTELGDSGSLSQDYNRASAVTVHDAIVYVGTYGSRLYGYDYRNPANPRLVAAVADFTGSVWYGEDEYAVRVATFPASMLFLGSDLYVAGFMWDSSLAQMNFSRPRNMIQPLDLYLDMVAPSSSMPRAPVGSAKDNSLGVAERLRPMRSKRPVQ